MKKIMFSDKFLLTQAVLEGRKTQTRRIVPQDFFTLTWDERNNTLVYENSMGDFIDVRNSKYALFKVGEVVSVAQSYKDADVCFIPCDLRLKHNHLWGHTANMKGWTNKMFVQAEVLPHQIRITDVRVERLQDISEDDCLKEGIIHSHTTRDGIKIYHTPHVNRDYDLSTYDVKEAFAHLINKVSGKDVWSQNPYVFVYDFELVK